MKIKWLEFENLKTGLKIERVNFYKDITLLVGLSGVGKTQILNALQYSLDLAINKNVRLEPYSVCLGIELDNNIYEWSYTIDSICNNTLILESEEEYEFIYEKLLCDDILIFERKIDYIEVVGYDKLPTPKKDESLLLQYAADEKFKELISAIRKSYSIEIELDVRGGIGKESFGRLKAKVKETLSRDSKIDFNIFSHLPVAMKLYIVKNYYQELYFKIFDSVKELFMEIEDIDVIEDVQREMYLVAIRVYGKTLLQHEISNGMLKTIYYIVELMTMPEDSLVLIDEFENGLGVNCIDILAEMMLSEREDLQFILTSHHPKIINQISKEKWKIVDRDGANVKNSNSAEYGIGNSQHDAYFNLINRWEYEGKI